jgi:hypothetical protein
MKTSLARREVLLALAVTLVGAGLCYKALEPRREQGHRADCQSNLKQIGAAIMQYTRDFDNTLPRAWFGKDAGASDGKTNYKWMDVIYPYVKNEQAFNCPSDSTGNPYHFRSGTDYGSYVINNAYFAAGDKFTPPEGKKLSEMGNMDNTVLVADGENAFEFSWADVKSSPQIKPGNIERNIRELHKFNTMTQRHFSVSNTLLCSGRVSGYGLWVDARPKTINGQTIYVGLTIEND